LFRKLKLIDQKFQLFTSYAMRNDAGAKKENNGQDIGNKGEI
jgi:hypothetical protein